VLSQTADILNRHHRTLDACACNTCDSIAPDTHGFRACQNAAMDSRPPLAVIDIDGVVADARHRLHLIEGKPRRWDEFFAAASQDPPLADGVALVRRLAADHEILWLTGRPERNRRLTATWLEAQGLPTEPLLMRPDRDFRPARLTKRHELRKLRAERQIGIVVDDDPDVIDLLAADGFPTKLADWLPHGPTLHKAQESDGRT
jgi:hypothetical protein